MTRTIACAAALLLVGSMAIADDDKFLTVGDEAPKPDIAHWIKGKEVTGFEPGKIYVMEFWATWCGPCKASMPHISELQEKYKDYNVTVVGVSDEELATVTGFLSKGDWNDKTKYTIATDPDKSVYNDYMKAAGQNGIPTAFVVGKEQQIEWIGHPMQIDEPLEQIVKGTWDREVFKAKWEEDQKSERELAKVQQKVQVLFGEYRAAAAQKDWDTAKAKLDEAMGLNPLVAQQLGPQKFLLLARDMNKPSEAYALANDMAEKNWDNAQLLNQLAWFTVDEPGIQTRDLDFAMKAANRASEITGGNDGAILDTVARVYFEKGDLDKALEIQKKAVENAPAGPMADQLRETLKKYEKAAAKM